MISLTVKSELNQSTLIKFIIQQKSFFSVYDYLEFDLLKLFKSFELKAQLFESNADFLYFNFFINL